MRKQWLFPIGKQKYKIKNKVKIKYTKGQNKPGIYLTVSHTKSILILSMNKI